MARISGKDGTAASVLAQTNLCVKEWSITHTQAAVDVTCFGDATRNKVEGIKDWSGSGQAIIQDGTYVPTMPAAFSATFSDGAHDYTGDIIITELTVNVVVDGEASVSFSFEGSGDLGIA